MTIDEIKHLFLIRKGFFQQTYRSIRLKNCEITIDNLLPDNTFQLSVCTPYNEKLDKIKKHDGCGAGEVKNYWHFETEDKLFDFIFKAHMV